MQAVLTQGVQNANDGLATLQTIDGGMSNISQLLDRARTLATQSASGTFTGDRSVLNSELQSVLSEINRQAQVHRLEPGRTFARTLSVFIGGGKDATGVTTNNAAISNGSVTVDLSKSAVDTQSLKLSSYQTVANAGTALATIKTNAAAGEVDFKFYGAGYDTGVSVAAQGVNNAASLGDVVTDINNAISTAAAGNTAFAAAGVQAQLNSTGTGIVFTSAGAAFAVSAGTNGPLAAENVLGTGAAATSIFAQGTQQVGLKWAADMGTGEAQSLSISAVDANGNLHTQNVSLVDGDAAGDAVTKINAALQSDVVSGVNGPLKGVVAEITTAGNIVLSGTGNFQVFVGSEAANGDGITNASDNQQVTAGSQVQGSGGALDIATSADAQTAVNALANAVANLGSAQAVVGKGENNFNYAINLAQSQLTNEAASESSIRDADMAAQAANLTKAQIMLQAGVAALAQANSAPQNILSLLKG